MRLVLDTNIVLSGLLWRGTPYQLLEAIRQQPNIQLYSSPALLEELADVLIRPSVSKRLSLVDKTAREILIDYVAAIELVEPTDTPRIVPNDPDDDHVIAAALAAQVDFIVSGDTDLLSMRSFKNMDILSAVQALQRVVK